MSSLLSLSGESEIDRDEYINDLFTEIDYADLIPIDSGLEVEGAYPPPLSC